MIVTNPGDRAYPTPVLAPATDFTWAAMLPSVYHGSSCCFLQSTKSLTPSHTPFASPTGATDTADPSGWLYTLVGVLFSDPETTLPSSNFSAMWTGQSFGFPYSGCPYTICDAFTPSAASATAVQSQAYLFVVRTVTTSGVDLLSLASGIPTASPPVTSGVEADPITAAPTSNPETSSLPSFSLFIQTSLSQFSAANAHQTVSLVSETPTLITKSTEDTSLLPAISTSQGETQPSKFVVTGSTNMKLSETTSGPQSTYSSTLKDSDAAQETVDAGALTNSLADASHSEPPTQTSDWMTTPVLTNCSSTISPNSASEYIIHTQTLRPGAAIAIFGSAISLASGVTEVVVGTSTETAASLSGLSGHIWSELGGGSTVSSNSDSGIFSNSGASSTPGTSQRSVTPNTDDRKTATELASSSAQTESSSDAAQPRRTGMGSAGLSIFALVLILV